jgi:hypothetical protein
MTLEEMYASMTTDQLVELLNAFAADLASAERCDTAVFCTARMSLIEAELEQRREGLMNATE